MSWTVDLEKIQEWLDGLDEDSYDAVVAALEILEDKGPNLGRPLVDTIQHSDHSNMKELRPGTKGRGAIRILFAFDPERRAIMLVAGDKENKWKSWYKEFIPVADNLWKEHLGRIKNDTRITK